MPTVGGASIDRDFPAAALARGLAGDRIRAGAPAEPLTPLYLRRPDAVEPGRPKAVTLPRRLLPCLRTSSGTPPGGTPVGAGRHRASIDADVFERTMFGTEAWTASGYRTELADTERRHYLVAQGDRGELLGWAGVMVVGDSAEILTVGVIPPARRLGIARLLIDGLLAEARARGAIEAFLEVRVDNAPAQRLYATYDFEPVGLRRGYYQPSNTDALVMMRRDL